MIIKKLNNDAPTPEYATYGSAGFDLRAAHNAKVFSKKHTVVNTGLRLQIPQGYEMQIRPRSGLALKHGVTVLNTPATIDSDYTGEIRVILINHGDEVFSIKKGDRIAQGVICKVYHADFEIVDALDNTERGNGGFGSTGVI